MNEMTLGHVVTFALVRLYKHQIWHVTFLYLSNTFCKTGQSKIQDGGHFPRWPRTNIFYFVKLYLIGRINLFWCKNEMF